MAEQSELSKKVADIQEFDASSIARIDEFGSELGFVESARNADAVISIFKRFKIDLLNELPSKHQNILNQQADNFWGHVKNIREFDIKAPNSGATRDAHINSFNKYRKGLYDNVADALAFQNYLETNSDDRFAKEKEEIREKRSELDRALEHHKKIEEEFSALTGKLRKLAAESGVTQEATHFHNEAEEHANGAKIWRGWIVVAACIVIAYVLLSMKYMQPPAETAAVINFVTNKLMIFGVLIFMLGMAAKNYLSHMHNKTVNRHRRNALLTYNSLVGGAISDEAKDTILKAASSCIYTPQDTGYTKQGSSSTINSIIEMMPKTTLEGKM